MSLTLNLSTTGKDTCHSRVSLVKEIFKYTMVNLTHVLRAGVKVLKVNQFNISKFPVDEKRRKSSVCLSSETSVV